MATDIFAKIGDIKGESLDAKHKDEIEVLSFSWGVSNTGSTGSGGGGATGKAVFQDLQIVHGIDNATPALLKACAAGQHIKDATITHRKAGKGQQEFLVITLNDVTIAAVSHTGDEVEPYVEAVSLKFAKVDFHYRKQRADGSLDRGRALQVRLEGQQDRLTVDTSDPASRELTIDEAIAVAIGLQKQLHLAEAEQLYARVLEVAPDHPDALHYKGLLAHQEGRGDDAITLIEKSLALVPDQADWHSNYAIVLQSHGRFDDAILYYQRRYRSTRSTPTLTAISACCCASPGGRKKPKPHTGRLSTSRPDHADAYTNLGILLIASAAARKRRTASARPSRCGRSTVTRGACSSWPTA